MLSKIIFSFFYKKEKNQKFRSIFLKKKFDFFNVNNIENSFTLACMSNSFIDKKEFMLTKPKCSSIICFKLLKKRIFGEIMAILVLVFIEFAKMAIDVV